VWRKYEAIRAVFVGDFDARKVANYFKIPSPTIYENIRKFRKFGLLGLFGKKPGIVPRVTRKEKEIIVIMKLATRFDDRRLLRELRIAGFNFTPHDIWAVMCSVGLGKKKAALRYVTESEVLEKLYARSEEDLLFEKINKPLKAKPRNLGANFFDENDLIQRKYEMVREYILGAQPTPVARKYGFTHKTLYVLLKRFKKFGMLGFCNMPSGTMKSRVVTPELQIKIIRLWYKGIHDVEIISRETGLKKPTIYYVLQRYRLRELKSRIEKLSKYIKKPVSKRLVRKETDFKSELEKLNKPLNICMPGTFILAPLLNELGVYQALKSFDLPKMGGYKLEKLFMLLVNHKFTATPTINKVGAITDKSLAISSGLAKIPHTSTIYNNLKLFPEDKLKLLRKTIMSNARTLGLIKGKRLAIDFHFSIYWGTSPKVLARGKMWDTKRRLCLPGTRALIAHDLDTNAVITIKRYDPKIRGKSILMEFIETELEQGLGAGVIGEIVTDSEFVKIAVVRGLVKKNIKFVLSQPKDKRIKKIIAGIDEWKTLDKNTGEKYYITELTQRYGQGVYLIVLSKKMKKTG
jgi:transposase